ncbi:unnamed protein product [Durusdinium trenchii]|uniref:FACT complex subunit n=1 Tax=Durusdinium trenchii TaxID=1381693 RepID=A0ABP0SKY5_9DINO
MTVTQGSTTSLKLEGFSPAWRQGLVVSEEQKKGRFFLAVRVLASELDEHLTSFRVDDNIFILVVGTAEKIRPSCSEVFRALETPHEAVLLKAQNAMTAESLQYATASEDVEPPRRSRNVTTARESESESDPFEDAGDSEGDELFQLLSRAKKKQLDKATASGSGERREVPRPKKNRFPLLSEKTVKEEDNDSGLQSSTLLQTLLAQNGKSGAAIDLNALVQMEILRTLQDSKLKKKPQPKAESENSDTSSEDSSSSGKIRLKGAGRAMKAYRLGHKRMKRHPLRHVRRYVREVEEALGAKRGTLLSGRTELTALQLTQLLRALHQCGIDNGNWKTAWLLMPFQDPLDQPRFGGETQDLEVIASYVRAMSELEKKSKGWADIPPGDRGKAKGGKSKGKGQKTDNMPAAE